MFANCSLANISPNSIPLLELHMVRHVQGKDWRHLSLLVTVLLPQILLQGEGYKRRFSSVSLSRDVVHSMKNAPLEAMMFCKQILSYPFILP